MTIRAKLSQLLKNDSSSGSLTGSWGKPFRRSSLDTAVHAARTQRSIMHGWQSEQVKWQCRNQRLTRHKSSSKYCSITENITEHCLSRPTRCVVLCSQLVRPLIVLEPASIKMTDPEAEATL